MKKSCAANFNFAKLFVCLAAIFVLTFGAAAQTDDTLTHEFTVWGGASPDSSTVFGIGRTEDARFGIVAFQYARRFNNNDKVNLKYTIDVVPAAVMNYPDFRFIRTGTNTFRVEQFRKTAYAFGVAPFGLQANFRPRKKIQPFVGASGGLLYFDKQIPNDLGTKFSFTADVGGGVEFNLKNKRALTVGYKYYHISNANRGEINPGFDQNLFYVGYRFFGK
jgi:opacity protein-like surface antigen